MAGKKSLKLLSAKTLQKLRPLPDASVWEICDQYRVLSAETAESPGPWRTDVVPHLKEPLECYRNKSVQKIILKFGIQLAKTEFILCILFYIFLRKPGSSMIMFPKKETAKNEFSAKRLSPMIRDSVALRNVFPKAKRKDKLIDTKDQKTYIGGSVKLVGTDKTDLASTPVRDLFVDEVSKFSGVVKGEGDVFDLAEGRTSNFFDAKHIYTSSPAEEGICHITRMYEASRQHIRVVPCPHCRDMIELIWENMVQDDDLPKTTRYRCQLCQGEIQHRQKLKLLASGEWLCTTPERPVTEMGYELSSLYSPWVSWEKLMDQYIKARNELQKGNEEKMRTFVNVRLCRTYMPQTEGVDDSSLYARRERYDAEVPAGVLYLTGGVDVNSNNICIEIVGWGEGDESWSIDYRVFAGDPRQAQVWLDLEEFMLKPFRHEFGFYIGIDAVAVDQGFLQKLAESFVKSHQARRFFAVKGEKGWGRPVVGDPYNTQKGKGTRKVPLYPVCDSEAKVQVYSDLQRESGPRGCHFPKNDNPERETYSRKFFQELTCERIKTKYRGGFPVREWEKPQHVRNEPLDCRKYAMAARIIIQPLYQQRRVTFMKRQIEYLRRIELGEDEKMAALFWFEGKNKISSPTGKARRPNNAGGSSWVKGW